MTEEPIIPEAPKRDFYYAFTDEAAAATALQPFYYQPQVQSVDPETGEKAWNTQRWLRYPAGMSTCASVAITCGTRQRPLMRQTAFRL